MQIADFDAVVVQIFGQVFGHFFGQGRYQNPLALGDDLAAFFHEVVNLVFNRTHDANRIGKPGRANDLFDEAAAALFQLPVAGGCGDKNRLTAHGVPFVKLQRSVVNAGRQTEAIIGQG